MHVWGGSGKLLGFIVSEKGIEVDPAKVKAIQEMPEPKIEKQVRGFLGRLNYIARFVSHLTATFPTTSTKAPQNGLVAGATRGKVFPPIFKLKGILVISIFLLAYK